MSLTHGTRRTTSAMKAAQYVRMSTEHQKYSIENQMDAIADYAACKGIEIVRTYADTARSGLSLAGRPQLGRLLADAQSGTAEFGLILVYDVSRWGRFQDTDESAHYEFLCKSAGVSIHYCAEQFDGDGMASSLLKVLKRAMAAEYSRELSVKVLAGQCRAVHSGFHPGGPTPYGIRRVLLDENGVVKGELSSGQYKSIRSERVTLTPGPAHEVEVVQRIFSLYVSEQRSIVAIAKTLNHERVPVRPGGVWTRNRVRDILTNESYIGNLVFSRQSRKFGGKLKWNAPDTWVRFEGAFEAIVDPACFRAAQQLIPARARRKTKAEMLEALTALNRRIGPLSASAIDKSRELPSTTAYRNRFGSLQNAFALIGHPAPRGARTRDNPNIRRAFYELRSKVVAEFEAIGVRAKPGFGFRRALIEINDRFIFRIAVVAARRVGNRSPQWNMLVRWRWPHDVMLAARMDELNTSVMDCYLLPYFDLNRVAISLEAPRNNAFRIVSLDPLLSLCSLQEARKGFPCTVEEFKSFLAAAQLVR